MSGLALEDTPYYMGPIVKELKPKIIIVMNGICDVTYIRTYQPWTIAMRDRSVSNTLHNYMIQVDNVHSHFYNLSEVIGHKPMIVFSTLTGIDIGHYNGYPSDLISPEQQPLNDAILAINRNIIALNKSMGIVTPMIGSEVHKRCRGRYRLATTKLWDGCHPTDELSARWAERLYENALINSQYYDNYAFINGIYN